MKSPDGGERKVKMNKISVIVKHPGQRAYKTNISNTLENLQKTVGGYIETVTVAKDACFICDEEGKLKGKEYNFSFGGIDFVGTVILCGVNGDEFASFSLDFEDAKKLFPEMWR